MRKYQITLIILFLLIIVVLFLGAYACSNVISEINENKHSLKKDIIKISETMNDNYDCIDGIVYKTIFKSNGSSFKRQVVEDGLVVQCK